MTDAMPNRLSSDPSAVQRVMIVEREVLGVINTWLGFVRGVGQLTPRRVAEASEQAVASRVAPYHLARSLEIPMLAARPTLLMFERIAAGIEFERTSEGKQVTPSWWVQECAGRAVTDLVVTTTAAMIETARREVVDRATNQDSGPVPLIRAVLVTRGLELIEKIEVHLGTVEAALERLATLRRAGSPEEDWPNLALDGYLERVQSMRRVLLQSLAALVPNLWTPAHDEGMPDLFGQGYRMLCDATFRALIRGEDSELTLELFRSSATAALQAHFRLDSDLAGEAEREQAIYGSEPLMDVMELSGCALLMNELFGSGIWTEVVTYWDDLLDRSDSVAFLAAWLSALRLREGLFLLTEGATMRTQRRMDLAAVFDSLGVRGWSRWGSRRDQIGPPPGQSPIVTAFAPDDMTTGNAFEELFIAEYVMNRPEAQALQIPQGAIRLRREIDRERDRLREEGGGDDS